MTEKQKQPRKPQLLQVLSQCGPSQRSKYCLLVDIFLGPAIENKVIYCAENIYNQTLKCKNI